MEYSRYYSLRMRQHVGRLPTTGPGCDWRAFAVVSTRTTYETRGPASDSSPPSVVVVNDSYLVHPPSPRITCFTYYGVKCDHRTRPYIAVMISPVSDTPATCLQHHDAPATPRLLNNTQELRICSPVFKRRTSCLPPPQAVYHLKLLVVTSRSLLPV